MFSNAGKVVDEKLWYDKLTVDDINQIAISNQELGGFLQDFLENGYVIIPNSVSKGICDQVLSDWNDY